MATTRIRAMTANFRLEPESEADIAAGRTWNPSRRTATVDLINALVPSVIFSQECSHNIRHDLEDMLAPNWVWVGYGHTIIWYSNTHHRLIGWQWFNLPSPEGTDPRKLIVANFQVKATGDTWTGATTHLTVGNPAQTVLQMAAAIETIAAYGDLANTIFGGDFNSPDMDGDSVRTTARGGRLFDLRSKLATARITNVGSSTFNGWANPAPQTGEWIDDILTGDNMQPYYARVVETAPASDHQFIVASSVRVT